MPYISQLLNNKVTDSSDAVAGKLVDILITPKENAFSPLEFLVIKTPQKERVFVPYEFVENFTSSEISLKNLFNNIAQKELPQKDFIYLNRDVLDKQIVDLGGTRVVRVNDLRIGNFENKMSVLAIDASFRGLLRRLGWESLPLLNAFKVSLIDWRQAQLLGQKSVQLNTVAENLSHLHPADLANIVEELDVQHGSKILSALDDKEAAKVVEELNPYWQNILVKYLGPQRAGQILAQMSPDEIVDLVKNLPEDEAREFLASVKGGKAENVKKLIQYKDNTAGGLMDLEFVTVRPDSTAAEALEEVKKSSDNLRSIVYVYVTDESGRFLGVASLRRLIIADPQELMKTISKSLNQASVLRPQDKIGRIVRIMTKYNLFTAVVLDKEKKLIGVVAVDNVMHDLFPET